MTWGRRRSRSSARATGAHIADERRIAGRRKVRTVAEVAARPAAVAAADRAVRARGGRRARRRADMARGAVARAVDVRAARRVATRRRPSFVPCWMFAAHAVAHWEGPGLRGIVEMDFVDLPISADPAADALPDSLAPWPSQALRPVDPQYAGDRPQGRATRDVGDAATLAHQRMERDLLATARRSQPAKQREQAAPPRRRVSARDVGAGAAAGVVRRLRLSRTQRTGSRSTA